MALIPWRYSGAVAWPRRMVKSPWKIEKLKKACEIGGKAWKRCLDEFHIGITQAEIRVALPSATSRET